MGKNQLIEATVELLARNTSSKKIHEESDKYPTSNHLHMDVDEGDERHIIKGISHSDKNADLVHHKISAAVAKHLKKRKNDVDEVYSEIPHHHSATWEPHESHKREHKVFNSVDEYVKHHAQRDAEWMKKHNVFGKD